jgi:ABC-type multidrug transport system permease subunit
MGPFLEVPSVSLLKGSLVSRVGKPIVGRTFDAELTHVHSLAISIPFWMSPHTMQGIQNEIFAIFLLMTIFTNLDQQIIPHFTAYRRIFQIREGPSKMYSWVAFLVANVAVEMVWQTIMSLILFACWYYPIGMHRNGIPTGDVSGRSALVFLFIWSFMQFRLSLSYLVVAGMESAATAVNIDQLLYSLSLIFCGVLARPSMLRRFWEFNVSRYTPYILGRIYSRQPCEQFL